MNSLSEAVKKLQKLALIISLLPFLKAKLLAKLFKILVRTRQSDEFGQVHSIR